MNPATIGTTKAAAMSADSDAEEDEGSTQLNDSTELVNQSFLLNPTLTVGQFLTAAQLECVGFVRYEIGESISDQRS